MHLTATPRWRAFARPVVAFVWLVLLAAPALAQSDSVTLPDGAEVDAAFKGYKDGKLQFNSAGFGDIASAPDAITTVDLAEARTMYVKDAKRSDQREITVRSEDGTIVYSESDGTAQPLDWGSIFLLSDEPIPTETWSGSFAATATLGRGNTNDFTFGLSADVARDTAWDHLEFHYEFGYSESGNEDNRVVSRRMHKAHVLYRYYLDPAWGIFGKNTFATDSIAGLEYRDTTDIGAFWQIIEDDESKTKWRVEGSINFTVESETGVDSREYVGARVATDFEQVLADTLKFLFHGEFVPDFDETDNWRAVLRGTFENDLGEGFTLKLVIENTYDNQPAPGFLANDFSLTAVFGYSF